MQYLKTLVLECSVKNIAKVCKDETSISRQHGARRCYRCIFVLSHTKTRHKQFTANSAVQLRFTLTLNTSVIM